MAEPNLTARSGEPATFLAGGEYPYSTVSDDGTNVEFKNFGIRMNFTPTVIDGNRISLPSAPRSSGTTSPRPDRAGRCAPAGETTVDARQRPELRHRRTDAE